MPTSSIALYPSSPNLIFICPLLLADFTAILSMSMVTLTPQPLSNDKNNYRISDKPLSSNFLPSKIKSKDGEIGIFGAEKYFNEEKNQKLPRKSPKKPPQIERMNPQEKKAPSESSWGSQKAFLQTFPPNPHQKKPKKSFLATIGCNCYCNDEKSVDTNDRPNEAIAASNSKKIGEEASQIMEEKNKKKKNSADIDHDHDGDKIRNSLEVFGSPKKSNSLRIEKRLAMLDVEVVEMCDDMYEDEDDEEGSDASSDLFEISSFTNSNSILMRRASDGPTTCYAPSEASVEWSVVTASAAEILSVFSDFEEPGVSLTKVQKKVVNGRKEGERRRSLGILTSGCKSQKAVRVSEDAYRANGEGVHDPRRNHIARSHGPVQRRS